jgi:glutamine synthetase
LLLKLENELITRFGATPIMGAELECYVTLTPEAMDAFWATVVEALKQENIPVIRVEKERGEHQYELVLGTGSPRQLADWIQFAKNTIEEKAKASDVAGSFAAKPYDDQPSSGLHIHTHLADSEGVNLYHKTEEEMSNALRFSLGGLMTRLEKDMAIFCPTVESHRRYDDADHVPRKFCWGVNNRYCALRIPMERDPYNKRIEHRMAGADADATKVIEAILIGILEGLDASIEPPAQEYGKPDKVYLISDET